MDKGAKIDLHLAQAEQALQQVTGGEAAMASVCAARAQLAAVEAPKSAGEPTQARKQAAANAYQHLLFDSVHDAIIASDATRRVTAWNHAAEKMFGWPADEVLGRPVTELFGVSTELLARLEVMFQSILVGGSYQAELTLPTRSGQMVIIELKANALHDPHSGQHTGCVSSSRDISLRRQMETQLKNNEQRLRAVLEHMPVGVWLLNSAGDIIMDNQAGQQIWQGARASCQKTFGEYRARRLGSGTWLQPEEWPDYRAVTKGETSLNELLEIECFDGTHKIIRNSSVPFWDTGKLLGVVVVNEDVTDLRQAQEALKHYTHELERSNRDLQDFAFMASHDLQEPLRKVKSFGDLLWRRNGSRLDAESQDHLERMQQASARMQRMIEDLLAYSRVATCGTPFNRVALGPLVVEAVADLEVLVERTGGQVIVAQPMPEVQADPGQIRLLFQNLIGNALKFHRPGLPPEVRVDVRPGGTNGDSNDHGNGLSDGRNNGVPNRVEIVVRDNGIGFDMEYAERIFKPFQRLHGRLEYEGNGIGLAICRRIIERHQGSISVISTPNEGSEFVVSLPVGQES